MEAPPSGQSIVTVESSSIHQDEAEKVEESLHIITMITEKDFKDNGHEKSGIYYLPECPPYNKEGCKSGLYKSFSTMSSLYPCGATYQPCHPKVPMIRFGSTQIADLRPMRI